jgi:geranylgeranyl diphosphate/geranylgeranyl-bacteriochlorophyllide a reductase
MRPAGLLRIAIIGGGPGGAQCARRLAEAGLEATIFEPRAHFEKACGGGIPARGIERFPFLMDAELPGKEIRACLILSPSGREARVPLADPLYVLSRGDLHSFMLSRATTAGARLVRARVVSFENCVRDPGRGPASWIVRATAPEEGASTEHGPFDYLVAADGAAGSARRHLLSADVREKASQGLGYYVQGVSEEFITLKFFDGLPGYLWVFPRPGHSSAGICAILGVLPAAALRALMDGFLKERYPAAALAASERYAALIPAAPRDPSVVPLQGDGWALLGDAAQQVDPLTREGIYYAMLSGDLLAEALRLGKPELYSEAWARHGAPELSWAAAHGEGFFDPTFVERMVSLSASSMSVARVLSDLIAGRQSYRTLKVRLLLNAPRMAAELAFDAVAAPFRRPRGN